MWIGVVCDDLEVQRKFYRDVLGLKEVRSGEGWVWFHLDGRLLELQAKSASPQSSRRGVAVGFEVDDIHVVRADLLARGVEALTEVEGGTDSNEYWAYFRDVEGNVFEIVQRLH